MGKLKWDSVITNPSTSPRVRWVNHQILMVELVLVCVSIFILLYRFSGNDYFFQIMESIHFWFHLALWSLDCGIGHENQQQTILLSYFATVSTGKLVWSSCGYWSIDDVQLLFEATTRWWLTTSYWNVDAMSRWHDISTVVLACVGLAEFTWPILGLSQSHLLASDAPIVKDRSRTLSYNVQKTEKTQCSVWTWQFWPT